MKRACKILCVLMLVAILMPLLPVTANAETLTYTGTVGQSAEFWFHMNYDSEVKEASIDNGSVPPGMGLSYPNPSAVTLSGTPTQSGSYTMYISVYTHGGDWLQYTLQVSINEPPQVPEEKPAEQPTEKPAGGIPRVTKNPTDETVEEGGEAVFVAKADYVQKYRWQLIAPDGTTYDCEDAPGVFAGLKVVDANTQRIALKNIPASMNGYTIRCGFVGGDVVYSAGAKITVTANPTEPPTEAPTAAPTEAPADAPAQPPAAELIHPATEAPTEKKETQKAEKEEIEEDEPEEDEKENGSNGLLIALIISVTVIAVSGIAAFVVLKLKGQKRDEFED